MANLNVLLKIMAALAPSTLLLLILFQMFPYTGLARIVSTPLTYLYNAGVLALGFLILHLIGSKHSIWVWITIWVVTIVITVWMYPQENKPHIIHQIWDVIKER